MAQKDRIAIDITGEKISIIIGTRFKILNAITIETPRGSYSEDEILDIELLRNEVNLFKIDDLRLELMNCLILLKKS